MGEIARVAFAITSPHFVFESGQAVLFRLRPGPNATLTTMAGETFDIVHSPPGNIELQELTIRNGETDPVAVSAAGPFQAMLKKLKVIRKRDDCLNRFRRPRGGSDLLIPLDASAREVGQLYADGGWQG